MQNLSKELEEKIKELIKQKNPIQAVMLVQQELKLGLKESKDIVDIYKDHYANFGFFPSL